MNFDSSEGQERDDIGDVARHTERRVQMVVEQDVLDDLRRRLDGEFGQHETDREDVGADALLPYCVAMKRLRLISAAFEAP